MAKWKTSNIDHEIRQNLGISINAYCVLDYIYKTQTSPTHSFEGWCNYPISKIADFFGFSKSGLKGIFDEMEERGFMEFSQDKRKKKTTELWYSVAYESDQEKQRSLSERTKTVRFLNGIRSLSERKGVRFLNDTLIYNTIKRLKELEWDFSSPDLPLDFSKEEIEQLEAEAKKIKKELASKKGSTPDGVAKVVEYLNQATGKNFKSNTSETVKFISARLKSYSVQNLYDVIDLKVMEWGEDAKMCEYLRPSTLFNESKFESYHQKVEQLKSGNHPKINNNGKFNNGRNGHNLSAERSAYRRSVLNGHA